MQRRVQCSRVFQSVTLSATAQFAIDSPGGRAMCKNRIGGESRTVNTQLPVIIIHQLSLLSVKFFHDCQLIIKYRVNANRIATRKSLCRVHVEMRARASSCLSLNTIKIERFNFHFRIFCRASIFSHEMHPTTSITQLLYYSNYTVISWKPETMVSLFSFSMQLKCTTFQI